VTTTEKHHQARERVAEQHARELAARSGANPSMPPALLNHEDLRRYYGITYSRQHLWRLVRAGVLPRPVALGIGKYARKAFRREDIEAHVASLSYVGGAGKAA
jgi:predicted DNA-binding transcriptional regulator AlpA